MYHFNIHVVTSWSLFIRYKSDAACDQQCSILRVLSGTCRMRCSTTRNNIWKIARKTLKAGLWYVIKNTIILDYKGLLKCGRGEMREEERQIICYSSFHNIKPSAGRKKEKTSLGKLLQCPITSTTHMRPAMLNFLPGSPQQHFNTPKDTQPPAKHLGGS